MPIAFIEERFNADISYGSSGGPSFSTEVFTSSAGFEQRNINWEEARCVYDVSHGIRDKADMEEILNFFYAVRGRATAFRYKDWSDYQLDAEQIATGDGVETEFQIIKTYSAGAASYERTIRKIVTPTAGPPTIPFIVTVADVLVDPADYSVNLNTGIITFDAAPTGAIKVTCEFDVPVRFDTDNMPITLEAFELESWESIPLVEIKTDA